MKINILVTTYNRPNYLKQCLDSLTRADMTEDVRIFIIDDNSTNEETIRLIHNYRHPVAHVQVFTNQEKKGIKGSLMTGHNYTPDADYHINLDPDAIVRTDFISVIMDLHARFPDHLITGFCCDTLNADGSIRHKIIEQGEDWNKKASVGGINMGFTTTQYFDWIQPALHTPIQNWDHEASKNAGNGIICPNISVIQHIGIDSAMGHGMGIEKPDTATTFLPLSLPNVTLIGVDSNYPRLEKAIEESCKDIYFGDVKALNITAIDSKQKYSDYCIKELYKHVETSHMLIIQYDGYVKNWKAWDKDWLQYDYIGAPWEWYTDGMQVGNGGFSLRSKRLMEIVATDPIFQTNNHPEDHVICRVHRKYLETKYRMKFAPVEVARKFSIEGYNHWNRTHTDQFGFHSTAVKFAGDPQPGIGKTAYIEQYFGIGDVIFSMQIARNLQKQGYKICWPVLPDYVEQLNRAYPDITFIDMWLTQPKFMEGKELVTRGSTYYVPLRWTYELMKVPFKDCMRSKYDFMHMDWETWRDARYARDRDKEAVLMKELGIEKGEPYTLVNRMFRSDNKGKAAFEQPKGGNIVEMTMRPNFSIFDWSLILENANEIHTVSTSIIYLLEMLDLKAEKVYVYLRKPQETSHQNYQQLMTRHVDKYIFMP